MQSLNTGSCAAPTNPLPDLDLLFAFEDLAQAKAWPVDRNVDDTGYADTTTQARWEAFEAAHGPYGRRPVGQQIQARIKRSSEYAHQTDKLFPVRVGKPPYGDYAVQGGPGGVYRLRDVNLYVIEDGQKYRLG